MIGRTWRRLKYFLFRERATRELEDEMRLHRELRAEALMREGADEPTARAEASRRFGRTLPRTEQGRDSWGWISVDAFRQDVKYAARRLRQHGWFTTAVVSILALGIGATTAMFSAIDAAFLRPLPFMRADELMTLQQVNVPSTFRWGNGPHIRSFDIDHVKEMNDVFSHVAVYAAGGLNLVSAERPQRVSAGVVSGDFFTTLGIRPLIGRAIGPADAELNSPDVVVLSWQLWQERFGGGEVLGTTVPLNTKRYEVIGVMPRNFSFPNQSDLWIPLNVPISGRTFEAFRGYLPSTVIARRAYGVSAEAAEARLQEGWRRVVSNMPREPGKRMSSDDVLQNIQAEGASEPLRDKLVGDRRTALLVLFGVTGLLLLIACANVTNLLLSYGAARSRELSLRSVLGATRGRLLNQLLAESVMLSVCGAAVGVAIAPATLGVLRTLMPASLAGVTPVQLDWRVLAFGAVLALATGILFGLWPAFGATRGEASAAIKSGGGHGASARGARRGQRVLVAAELALAGVLLVGAGLMLRSFERLVGTETGMNPEQVATLEMSFVSGTGAGARVARVDAILANVRRVPGVVAAGVVNDLPLRGGGGIGISVEVEGAPPEAKDEYPRYLIASEGYLEALGIAVRSGRTFTPADGDTARPVALISESMARTFWPATNPLGRTFLFGGESKPITVVGVVADVREGGLERDPGPQMYFPARSSIGNNIALVVRGTGSPAALLAAMRQAVRDVDPSQPVYNVRTMDEVVGASMAARKANTVLITLFGGLALLIAALGVYAVTSNAVAQRTREFGIRAALGATRGDLMRHVSSEMMVVIAIGVVAGAGVAWVASRVMTGLVYGIDVRDPGTFALSPILLIVAAIAATLIPARRATRVQPVEVMRED
jgi:putative ABC transport system permease protein